MGGWESDTIPSEIIYAVMLEARLVCASSALSSLDAKSRQQQRETEEERPCFTRGSRLKLSLATAGEYRAASWWQASICKIAIGKPTTSTKATC